MDQQVIYERLLEEFDYNLHVYDTIDSTNAEAKRRLLAGKITKPTAIIADHQTAGYGRHGRNFYSPSSVGLYLSLVWPIELTDIVNPGQITTGLAVAAVEAISDVLHIDVGIKWINDLYYLGHKVAGILVEAQNDALVIGIGLNINPTDYPELIQGKVGALTQDKIDRNDLAIRLIQNFDYYFTEAQLDDVMLLYRERSLVIGQPVQLLLDHQEIHGIAENVQADGGLVVRTARGNRTFYSGEITKLSLPDWRYS